MGRDCVDERRVEVVGEWAKFLCGKGLAGWRSHVTFILWRAGEVTEHRWTEGILGSMEKTLELPLKISGLHGCDYNFRVPNVKRLLAY